MNTILRLFFHLLYHQLAFTYDLVAATVSMGKWKNWVLSVAPFVEGNRILEIGHGPGHLQRALLKRNLLSVGIDESAEMGRLAKRNWASFLHWRVKENNHPRTAHKQLNLTRGVAQFLPFENASFDTIVATFPTAYIRDPQTLAEVKRCLSPGGRLIVLSEVLPKNRFSDWLFKVTNQRSTESLEIIQANLKAPYINEGFNTEIQTLDVKSALLLIVLVKNG